MIFSSERLTERYVVLFRSQLPEVTSKRFCDATNRLHTVTQLADDLGLDCETVGIIPTSCLK